jgi:hypothetical protein
MQYGNILQFNNNDNYTENAVIRPPKEYMFYENAGRKYTRVVIDSKDRDLVKFPNPNDYEITLDDDINNIVSAQLMSADIPFPSYIINTNFNTLRVITTGTTYDVILSNGNYSVTELASHIQESINTTTNTSNFVVEYDTRTDNFHFKSYVPFALDFRIANPLSMLLGFNKKAYISSNNSIYAPYSHNIKSEFRKNFNYNNYVHMLIDQFELNKGNTKCINQSFAILSSQSNSLALVDGPHVKKYFLPPLGKFNKFKVKFLDRYGNLYDFQNQDHKIELLLISIHHQKK